MPLAQPHKSSIHNSNSFNGSEKWFKVGGHLRMNKIFGNKSIHEEKNPSLCNSKFYHGVMNKKNIGGNSHIKIKWTHDRIQDISEK